MSHTNGVDELKVIIQTDPLWYQNEKIKSYISLFNKSELTKPQKSQKDEFKKLLKSTKFFIGDSGYNWDQWRLPIDAVVIHHTSSSPTISLNELNVVGLRLFIEQFLKDEDVINTPLYSGHYWYGKPRTKENMTFVSYHYLIRPNGRIIQLVEDSANLWHAGNLEINRKSIGIALAGKFIDKDPSIEAINSVAKIIREHKISKDRVFGHNEVIKKEILGETECPGSGFINIWKPKLLSFI